MGWELKGGRLVARKQLWPLWKQGLLYMMAEGLGPQLALLLQ